MIRNPASFSSLMPVLSRGKHRSPARGACFMEYASHVAGERFSDHPSCTDPSLASLARLVNDWTTDRGRSALATLVPSVIGLIAATGTSARDRIDLVISILAASAAVPVSSEPRQRTLAIALLQSERELDERFPDDASAIRGVVHAALDQAPSAAVSAAEFTAHMPKLTAREEARRARLLGSRSDAIVAIAIAGIGEACVIDADARLRALLESAIDWTRGILARPRMTMSAPVSDHLEAAVSPAA